MSSRTEVSETAVSERTLKSLYRINQNAKKYARKAREAYRCDKGARAKRNSVRKKALYRIKTTVLEALVIDSEPDRVEQHEIDGRDYYALTFDGQSFHVPVENWSGPTLDPVANRELEDFDATSDVDEADYTLKESLKHVRTAFGENANDYLEEEYVDYRRRSYFAGWKYL